MWCIVNLPDGTQQAVKLDTKAIGQECLEKVCKALGIICEMEYFGLEHWQHNQEESRTHQWINLRNRLSGDSNGSSGIQLMLKLRVKFWVPVHFILQESVRNLFYVQAKVDLLEGRLNAKDWRNAAKLAALLCQADGIRFNDASLKAKCPIRMQKEYDLLLQQQQHQQQVQMAQQHKDRKEREYGLSFKKRRLSKQKSLESIENSPSTSMNAAIALTNHLNALSAISSSSINSTSAEKGESCSSNSPVCRSNETAGYNLNYSQESFKECITASPLYVYQSYLIRSGDSHCSEMPEDFLHQIAQEHAKLSKLKMTQKSAKYWLLQEIQELQGYGEEVFSGVTINENSVRCDIAVGAHGITVSIGDEKDIISFSAIAAAKSFRRTFKLEYVNDHNDRKDLEIKLPKHAIAAGLYRSITERHAFYVCDKVRGVVTSQFTRDLKGTIASMFKEDTELGKRYVFDIQHTCREVHDQARRVLHERGIEFSAQSANANNVNGVLDDISNLLPRPNSGSSSVCSSPECSGGKAPNISSYVDQIDMALREKEEREAAIERCVELRISEAMTCKICMDRTINTMFNPCCHVLACNECAARCFNCPNCRVKVTSVVKIYLPPELRTSNPIESSDVMPKATTSA